jgi:phosphatidylinositol alpha 1,6-mannosyltransferase
VRIALFSGNYNYIREGANQALNRLVRYAEQQGHSVRVYSPVTDTPAFEPEGTLVPVPSIPLPVRSEFRLAYGLPKSIRRDLVGFDPDVVHVSTPDILDTRAQSFAIVRGIPVVASLHTRFETYLAHYGLSWLRPVLEAHLHRFYRRSQHVLAPTPGLVEELKHIRCDDAVDLWSRGVDRVMFSPAHRSLEWRRSVGVADDEMIVLYFGRLVLEKGVRDFAATMRRLQDLGTAVRPLIVGAGPAQPILSALPGAILTGHLDGHALSRAVASADAMLSTSSTEAFGNVVLEAMASGLPVVSADAASASPLVSEGQSGNLCPAGDISAYAMALRSLCHDPALRRRLGAKGRELSSSFCWEAASEAVVEVYRKVITRTSIV